MESAINFLKNKSPVTGKDFAQACGLEIFNAWKFCSGSPEIITRIVGNRYLRLDSKVEGFARLSPSIMREFLNYTIIGLAGQEAAVSCRARLLSEEIAAISRGKINLARETIERLVENHHSRDILADRTCFIIAGDVVFGMAHAELRPESSTGELVKGSDLDIIAITEDLPLNLYEELDNLIYKEKYNLLMNPASKEELDYIVKELSVVSEQLKFGDFKSMVASKILDEGQYLFGSRNLFDKIKKMIKTAGVAEKIMQLEKKAIEDRIQAVPVLLTAEETGDRENLMTLFYTTEEKEEIF
jgi:flagellar biosynthesis/type III secretory pathway chaperone